jgi:hypothetical protein
MAMSHHLLTLTAGVIAFLVPHVVYTTERDTLQPPQVTASQADMQQIERGRYLVKIAACNDCHTPGYFAAGGKVPEQDWLIGDRLGFRGPWGTTYAINLRLYMQNLSEDQWVMVSHSMQPRPPMPWFILHDMTEQDTRAIYQFIRYLGPSGSPAPAYLAPDQEPPQPYIQFPQPPP